MINMTWQEKKILKRTMTKKEWKRYCQNQRAFNGFNTGTRDMETDKHPTRARQKELDRAEMM